MKFTSAISLFVAVQTVAAGQFITGPCNQDSDCNPFAGQQGCCERTQKICRAVLSLTPGVQACGDGRTPNFSNGQKVVNIDAAGGNANQGKAKAGNGAAKKNGRKGKNKGGKAAQKAGNGAQKAGKAATGSGKPPGTQFITGACGADSDCASTCCERTSKVCRAPLSLKPNVEFCGDGRTTKF